MISPSTLRALAILLPLGVSAAPPAQAPTGAPASQTIEVTAAAPTATNGLQVGAPSPNVMANNAYVNATTYSIDTTEWDSVWAANANSTLLNAPNGVVDTSVTVLTGDNAPDLSNPNDFNDWNPFSGPGSGDPSNSITGFPDCKGNFPGDSGYNAADACATGTDFPGNSTMGFPDCKGLLPGAAGYNATDECATGVGGFPDCNANFPGDPGYNAADQCATGTGFLDAANSTDITNLTAGNFSLGAGGQYPDCQGNFPGERGYNPNDECARGDSGGGSGGGSSGGDYPDCNGRYPDEPGFVPDECSQGGGGSGGGGSGRSTRFYLEFNVGGRSAVEVVISGDTETLDAEVELWVLQHFKILTLKGNLGKGISTDWNAYVSQGKVSLKVDDDKPLCRDELEFALDMQLRVVAWKKIHIAVPDRQIADFPYKRGDQCTHQPGPDPSGVSAQPPVATTGNTATS